MRNKKLNVGGEDNDQFQQEITLGNSLTLDDFALGTQETQEIAAFFVGTSVLKPGYNSVVGPVTIRTYLVVFVESVSGICEPRRAKPKVFCQILSLEGTGVGLQTKFASLLHKVHLQKSE
jgi:hypothetical protein